MLGVLSMGLIDPSLLYSSFFITTLRLYEWPPCSEPSCVKYSHWSLNLTIEGWVVLLLPDTPSIKPIGFHGPMMLSLMA